MSESVAVGLVLLALGLGLAMLVPDSKAGTYSMAGGIFLLLSEWHERTRR